MRKTPTFPNDPIREKSFNLAIKMVRLCQQLQKEKKEFQISKQIFRSGTNPAAMVRESKHAESGKDFIHKLAIGQKETQETMYWLELLYETDFISKDDFQALHKDTEEVLRLITSSILTKKRNLLKKR